MQIRPSIRLCVLVCLASAGLPAQSTYTSHPGQTTTFSYFTPPSSPAPKVPATPSTHVSLPTPPTVPADLYQAAKAASAAHSQSSFPAPPGLQIVAPHVPDPVSPIAGIPTSSWQAILDTGLEPASPDIAVGPFDVLMVVNSAIAQFSKDGTMKVLTQFSDWFSPVIATACPLGANGCLIYDPWIRYDQLHGRFLFLATSTTFANGGGVPNTSRLLLSVSNGATYDSGWKIWALDVTADGTTATANWGDSWRLGFDNVAVYLSGNMFNSFGNFQYAKVRVISKAELYSPTTATLHWQEFGTSTNKLMNEDKGRTTPTIASSLMPAEYRGKPSAGMAPFFVNAADPPALPASYLTVWQIPDPFAIPLTLKRYTVNGALPYAYPAPAPQKIPQPGNVPLPPVPSVLDTSDSRLLRLVYRDGFLYTARNSGYADQATTVTFDIINTAAPNTTDSTLPLTSQSRLTKTNSFYPAFDIPATTPSGTQFATASIITGTTTAADGSLTFAGISHLKAGEDYFDTFNANRISRWGDYFGGAIDPITGGLWASGQYAKPRAVAGFGIWGTWVGYFPWLTTQAFTDVPATDFYADYINVLYQWRVTIGCTTTTFCPNDQVTRGQMAAFVIRSMFGDNNFTYSQNPYFIDVPATHPFFSYIQKMRDLGIVTNGCSPISFCPDQPITRSDSAIFLVRGKIKALLSDTFTYPSAPYFTDVLPGTELFPYVQKLREMGLTSGCTTTTYCPDRLLKRQEMAVFLVRAFLN
jgi:hypothetical protein